MSQGFIEFCLEDGVLVSMNVSDISFLRRTREAERKSRPHANAIIFFRAVKGVDPCFYTSTSYDQLRMMIQETTALRDDRPERMMEL